jgi:hypothetical protein
VTFYWIALGCSVVATLVVVGSICAAIAEWKGASQRRWFAVGAVVPVAAFFVSGWLSVALTALPIVAVVARPSSLDDRYLSFRDKGRRSDAYIKLGVVSLVALFGYAIVGGGTASSKRSASTSPTINSTEAVLLSGGDGKTPARYGLAIDYTFTVDNQAYEAFARRDWSTGRVGSARVCYDPTDPGGSHALETDTYSCGGFDPFHEADR